MTAILPHDRVEWHLWNWQLWIESSSVKGGYPKVASGGMECYVTMDHDNDGKYQELDRSAGAAVDACLESLDQRLKVAVYVHHHVMAAVYRLRDQASAYAEACDKLAPLFAKRGLF